MQKYIKHLKQIAHYNYLVGGRKFLYKTHLFSSYIHKDIKLHKNTQTSRYLQLDSNLHSSDRFFVIEYFIILKQFIPINRHVQI